MTPRAGPLRILVVDDEPAILRFLHASLESQGYIVSTAANAQHRARHRQGASEGAAALVVVHHVWPEAPIVVGRSVSLHRKTKLHHVKVKSLDSNENSISADAQ